MAAENVPVIFVPGIGGSTLTLVRRNRTLWGTRRMLTGNFDDLTLPGTPMRPDRVIRRIILLPPFAHSVYGGFIRFLQYQLGYKEEEDLFLFSYDWRQDCEFSAKMLRTFIQEKTKLLKDQSTRFTIIAHSMGGLVARYCSLLSGMQDRMSRIVTVGTPHRGSPDALKALLCGASIFPARFRQRDTISAVRSFPSAYQLLPVGPGWIEDQRGRPIDLFEETNQGWLDSDESRKHMELSYKFHQTLSNTASKVPIYSVFGYGQRTLTRVVVPRLGNKLQWDRVGYRDRIAGDGTVPEASAIFDGDLQCPVNQRHASLLDDMAVHEFIKPLLSTRPATKRNTPSRPKTHELFVELNDSIYAPGSEARIRVGLRDPNGKIVRKARFRVELHKETYRGDSLPMFGALVLEEKGTLEQGQLIEASFIVPTAVGDYYVRVIVVEPYDVGPMPVREVFRVSAGSSTSKGT